MDISPMMPAPPQTTTSWPGLPDFESRRGPLTLSLPELESRASPLVVEAAGYGALIDGMAAGADAGMGEPHASTPVPDAVAALAGALAGKLPQIDALLGAAGGRFPNPVYLLQMALAERDHGKVEALLSLGAATDLQILDIEVACGEETIEVERATALTLAVLLDSEAGRLELLPLVARYGDLRQVDDGGRTLLHDAFHMAVVEYLLAGGLSLDTPDGDGVTPRDVLSPSVLANLEQRELDKTVAPASTLRDRSLRL